MTAGAGLEGALRALRTAGRRGIIPFVMAGDGGLPVTRDVLHALAGAGAAALEVGVPFSDPVADGPVIQAAAQRALAKGTTLESILRTVEDFTAREATPVVLFSYLNPLLRLGVPGAGARLRAAGCRAALVTDAPPGAHPELEADLQHHGIEQVFLAAPNTPPARLALLQRRSRGFLYLVARRGVTGAGGEDQEFVRQASALDREGLPVYAGFGVRSATDVRRLGAHADGVIVGSALVETLHRAGASGAAAAAGAFLRQLTQEES